MPRPKFSPLKLLEGIKDLKLLQRAERLFDEAPQTPQFYSEGAVKRMLGEGDTMAIVPPDYPFQLLSGEHFSTTNDDVLKSALRDSVSDRGVALPPRMVISPDDAGKPQVNAAEGWQRYDVLSELGMDQRPIELSSLAGDRWLRTELPRYDRLSAAHAAAPTYPGHTRQREPYVPEDPKLDWKKGELGRRHVPGLTASRAEMLEEQKRALKEQWLKRVESLGPRDMYPTDVFKLKERLKPFKTGGGALAVLKD